MGTRILRFFHVISVRAAFHEGRPLFLVLSFPICFLVVRLENFCVGQLMLRFSTYMILGLAGLLGGGSLIVFTAFLYAGSLRLTDLCLSQKNNLWLDAGLSLLFFIQHSGMV